MLDRPPPVHARGRLWVPAFAGTTEIILRREEAMPRCRYRDESSRRPFRKSEKRCKIYAYFRNEVLVPGRRRSRVAEQVLSRCFHSPN